MNEREKENYLNFRSSQGLKIGVICNNKNINYLFYLKYQKLNYHLIELILKMKV